MNGMCRGLERYAPHLLHLFSPSHMRTGRANGSIGAQPPRLRRWHRNLPPPPFTPPSAQLTRQQDNHLCAKGAHSSSPSASSPHSHEQTTCEQKLWDPPPPHLWCRKVHPYFSHLCCFTTRPSPVAMPPPLYTCHLPLPPPVCHIHRLLPFPRTPEEGCVPQTVFACAPLFLLSCAAPLWVPPPPPPHLPSCPLALVRVCGVRHALRAGVNGCAQTKMWGGGTACTPTTARMFRCPRFPSSPSSGWPGYLLPSWSRSVGFHILYTAFTNICCSDDLTVFPHCHVPQCRPHFTY